jgi:hypothetical protein
VAAGLVVVLMGYEYADLVINASGSNTWVWLYPTLFVAALMAHGRKPKTPEPELQGLPDAQPAFPERHSGAAPMGLWVWAVIAGILAVLGGLGTLYEIAVEHKTSRIFGLVLGFLIWAALANKAIRRQGLSPRWFWVTLGTAAGPLVLVPIWHNGREWKSTPRKVVGWLFFMAVLAYVVWSFFQGWEER